jgi:hypothetical protein
MRPNIRSSSSLARAYYLAAVTRATGWRAQVSLIVAITIEASRQAMQIAIGTRQVGGI